MMEYIICKWMETQGIPVWAYPATVVVAGVVGGVAKFIAHIRQET